MPEKTEIKEDKMRCIGVEDEGIKQCLSASETLLLSASCIVNDIIENILHKEPRTLVGGQAITAKALNSNSEEQTR